MAEQIIAAGHEDAITKLIGRIGQPIGPASSVEIGYDRADGPPLREDEEPDLDEAIAWTATAEMPDGPDLVGIHIVPPGGAHADGALFALISVAEQAGIHVQVLDAR